MIGWPNERTIAGTTRRGDADLTQASVSETIRLREALAAFADAECRLRRDFVFGNHANNAHLWREHERAETLLLVAQRAASAAAGRPHALEWPIAAKWTGVNQDAVVIVGISNCAIAFGSESFGSAITFRGLLAVRTSNIGTNAIHGHALFGSGLRANGRFIVANSPWIADIRESELPDSAVDDERASSWTHYLLCFRDQMVEVVSGDIVEWRSADSRGQALHSALHHVAG